MSAEHRPTITLTDLAGQPEFEPIVSRVTGVVEDARNFSLEGKHSENGAVARIEQAMGTFGNYAVEAEVIARDLLSPEYEAFLEEATNYLQHVRIGFIACPDGRLNPIAFGDPRGSSIYRKLQGALRVQQSFRTNEPITVNPTIKAAIHTSMRRLNEQGQEAFLFEGIGPHVNSSDPSHGCGAAIGALTGPGSGLPPTPEGLWDGGLTDYFTLAESNQAFEALSNVARLAGGKGFSVDLTHDIRTQGLIFGLRAHYRELDQSQGLRNSLLMLADDGDIVMTEMLAEQIRRRVVQLTTAMDDTFSIKRPKDIRNFLHFASNAMLIGRVSLELSREYEKEDFSFLPRTLIKNLPEKAIRVLGYTLLRNAAYQIITGIHPDEHSLVHHPERVMRAGPLGGDFNVGFIPFILGAPDVMTDSDINDAVALYGLMARFLPTLGVNLETEARLVMATGAYNPNIYSNQENAQAAYEQVQMNIYHNAGKLRDQLENAVQRGYAVVLPVIHHPTTRAISVAI